MIVLLHGFSLSLHLSATSKTHHLSDLVEADGARAEKQMPVEPGGDGRYAPRREQPSGVFSAVGAGAGVALTSDAFNYAFNDRIKCLRLTPEPKPKDALQSAGQRLSLRPASKLTMRWQMIDGLADRIRRHLRPLGRISGAISLAYAECAMVRVFPLLHKHVILSDTVPRQWTGRRPGCHPGGAGVGDGFQVNRRG